MEYRLATKAETAEIIAEAKAWFEDAPNSAMFSSSAGVSTRAVAEYIANQRGLSLWETME